MLFICYSTQTQNDIPVYMGGYYTTLLGLRAVQAELGEGEMFHVLLYRTESGWTQGPFGPLAQPFIFFPYC